MDSQVIDGTEALAASAPVDQAAACIPKRAHLIWFGAKFPWLNVLAVKSAALRGGFDEVLLHHDTDLSSTPHYRELVETPKVMLKPLDVPALLERCAPYTQELMQVYGRLRTPATRSDLARWAILFSEGGVYLDIDTVTIRSFAPLCESVSAFCGLERIVYPAHVRNSRALHVQVPAALRSLLRTVLRVAPGGWATFQRLESLFHLAANPAVLASAPRAPLVTRAIANMIATEPDRQHEPNVIGPHLLQRTLAGYQGDDVQVHPPAAFFPLGPEISTHWFRPGAPKDLERVISPDTRVVHWYGSVRTKHLVDRIDPNYVRANAHQQLFSSLALPFA